MRPGPNVTAQSVPSGGASPTNTGTWFVVGVTSQGPTGAQPVTSFSQFQQVFGLRGTNAALLSDSLEAFFGETGGGQVYVSRVIGPSATAANITIKDASNANSIAVSAIGPGAYANGYQIVVAGTPTSYTITVLDAGGNQLEQSQTLTSVADAVAYGKVSQYVTVAAVGATSPAAGTYTLVSGNDDLADITTTSYQNALAAFTSNLGPGQVSAPGVTTTPVITALFTHAGTFNRIAVADLPDISSRTALAAQALAITQLGVAARPGCLCAPWADISPIPGTTAPRAVPPSAFFAAKMATNDVVTGNPNQPAAGRNGILTQAVDLHYTWNDTDRQALNYAGVNVIKPVNGQFRIYGYVTPVNRYTDPLYWQLGNVRLDMAITADALAIEEDFMFSQIDGQGVDATKYGNALKAMLLGYLNKGALFSDISGVPSTAFTVDTSPAVNTPATESQGELIAVIAVRRSPMAEQVNLNIVRYPITQSL